MSDEKKINLLEPVDVAEKTPGELRLGKAAEAGASAGAEKTAADILADAAQAAEQTILDASPQMRCALMVKRAAERPCASDEARMALAIAIDRFARYAVDFLTRADLVGLESAISAFDSEVRRLTPAS